MEEFRILLEIEYNGDRYKVLSNKRHQKYFLKVLQDKTLMYPTMEKFKELYNIFKNKEIKKYCFETNNQFKAEGKAEKGKIKIEPKVILGKTLISLAVAIAIIAGSQKISPINGVSSDEQGATSAYNTEQQSTSNFYSEQELLPDSEDKTINFLELADMQAVKIGDGVYAINSWKNNIYCNSSEEFSQYVEFPNPTYNDVRLALEKNENIKDEYKEIIQKGIDNLEQQLPEMNLSILYFNISRMKIVESTLENIKEECDVNTIAYFDKRTGEVVIDPNIVNNETILHETIGHGSTSAIMQNGDKTIYMGTDLITYFEEAEDLGFYGNSFSEAEADMIAKISLGQVNECWQSYIPISEQLRIFMETVGIDLTTLVNKGTNHLIEEMYTNGINDPFIYVEHCDALCTAMQQELPIVHPEMSVKYNLKSFLEEYAKAKLNNGENLETIISEIDRIISDTDFSNIIVFSNMSVAEDIELSELKEEVVENIKQEER